MRSGVAFGSQVAPGLNIKGDGMNRFVWVAYVEMIRDATKSQHLHFLGNISANY